MTGDGPADLARLEAGELGLPVSAKAIVIVGGRVLLARNHRNEWELPGGRPDPGESLSQAVVREVFEETGLAVDVSGYIDWWDYPIAEEGVTVRVISFLAALDGTATMQRSDEHTDVDWHPVDVVNDLVMPDGYKRSISVATAGLR